MASSDTKQSDDFKKSNLIGTIGTSVDSANTVIARTSNGTPSNQYSTIVPKGEQGTSASQSTDKIKSETLATVQKLKSMSTVVKAVPAAKCTICNLPIPEDNIPGKKYCSDKCTRVALLQQRQKVQEAFVFHQIKRARADPDTDVPHLFGLKVGTHRTKTIELVDMDGGSSRSSMSEDQYAPPKKKRKPDDSFDWMQLLKTPGFEAATVSQIKHAPLSRLWENVNVGMKLEVENKDIILDLREKAYWVASVMEVQGYYGLLRYEGFGSDSSSDFWIHLCSDSIHHVGWCAHKGKPLIPPNSISKKFTDWRNFLVNRLTGARTLPLNFRTKITNGMKTSNFHLGTQLEVIDKTQISQLRVAEVTEIVGRRLHVQYLVGNDDNEFEDFWCHEESRLIHHAGWAKTVGHKILTPPGYNPDLIKPTPYDPEYEAMNLKVGMKLEAIDPLNLSAICAATIKKVLHRGYVMVRIDSYEEDSSGNDWFCFHISSPSVFYCGFCVENGITLTPPTGYEQNEFDWNEYFKETNSEPAPIKIKKLIPHKFKVGMKVEAADLMDPRLICVATVSRVVGRLLKIHFDGWEDDFDQWMDARSPDIYPIGWCELTGHKLEPPRPAQVVPKPPPSKKSKKGKKKVTSAKGAKSTTSKNVPKTNNGTAGPSSKNGTPKLVTKSTESISSPAKMTPVATATSSGSSFPKPNLSIPNSPVPKSSNGGVGAKEVERRSDQVVPATKATTISGTDDTQLPNDPTSWSVDDVVMFLIKSDCGPHAEGFRQNEINGDKMLTLTKDQIIEITGMKVGPAVKIFEIISQLKKRCVSVAKARKV